MERRGLAAGLVVVLLVVATVGAVAPPQVPESVGDPDTTDRVRVTGGDLDVNAQALFDWTEDALDRDVPQTPTVQITSVDESQLGGLQGQRFTRLVVLDSPDAELQGGVLAFVSGFSTDVTINEDRLPSVRNGTGGRTVEGLLVHEYTHVIQFQTPAFARSRPIGVDGSDGSHAWNAMAEGGAEFVADHYVEDDRVAEVGETWSDPRTPATYRLVMWDYYRGMVYLHDRFDEPAQLWTAYEEPPRTTAAIVRGEPRGAAPPNRTVDVRLPDQVERDDDRLGAWFVEVALSRNVDPERARSVATGWRWDELTNVAPVDGTGPERHVWITEWRNESAADDFEAAMTDYLDDRWERTDGAWTGVEDASFALQRPDRTSVAVVVGPGAFLDSVAVEREGEDFAIEGDEVSDGTSAAVADPDAGTGGATGPDAVAAGD